MPVDWPPGSRAAFAWRFGEQSLVSRLVSVSRSRRRQRFCWLGSAFASPECPRCRVQTRKSGVAGFSEEETGGAGDFFVDYFTTAVGVDEVLVAIRVPKLGDGWGFDYQKFHRTAQAWAIVGAAFRILAPGAPFIQFTYGSKPSVPAAIIADLGLRVERRALVLLNLPPARVYHFTRP